MMSSISLFAPDPKSTIFLTSRKWSEVSCLAYAKGTMKKQKNISKFYQPELPSVIGGEGQSSRLIIMF